MKIPLGPRLLAALREFLQPVAAGPKSKAIGNAKAVSIVFSIIYDFLVLVQVQVKWNYLS
ncbi:MAG: hypothetical protein WBX14_04175 [Candidatus Udaeobacter sp.]